MQSLFYDSLVWYDTPQSFRKHLATLSALKNLEASPHPYRLWGQPSWKCLCLPHKSQTFVFKVMAKKLLWNIKKQIAIMSLTFFFKVMVKHYQWTYEKTLWSCHLYLLHSEQKYYKEGPFESEDLSSQLSSKCSQLPSKWQFVFFFFFKIVVENY